MTPETLTFSAEGACVCVCVCVCVCMCVSVCLSVGLSVCLSAGLFLYLNLVFNELTIPSQTSLSPCK